jgi:hypothetical protein
MPLTAGARLGPCQIVGPLGTGGMGSASPPTNHTAGCSVY